MSFFSFNPTLASATSVGRFITPAPVLASDWSVSSVAVNLNLSDNTGSAGLVLAVPTGIRALTISFMARYMPTTTGNLFEGPQVITPAVTVFVGRSVATQAFQMWPGFSTPDYSPVGAGPFAMSLDIDVTGITYQDNGNLMGTVLPEEPIAVDDYITVVELSFTAGLHVYTSGMDGETRTASQFGMTSVDISPLGGIPSAFWTSLTGTKETL